MILDVLRLREASHVALLGAGGRSTLQAILERESASDSEVRSFYEVGASGGKCLKLYEPGTAALRPGTDCAVVVAGLGALDWPVGEVCDGYALRREWAAEPARPCDEHMLLSIVRETLYALPLPKEQVRVLLNQADTGTLHVRASDLLRALQDEGYFAAALSLLY